MKTNNGLEYTAKDIIKNGTYNLFLGESEFYSSKAENFESSATMAMPEALEKKKSGIIKVLKAHKKAVDFLNSSPTAGNDIIAKAFKLQPVTNEKTGKKYSGIDIVANARKRLGWAYELTAKDSAFIQRLMDYSYNLKYIKKKLKSSDIVDVSYMDAALK